VIAAKRNQVREIIIPNQNEKDLEEIPANVKKGIVFHPVERMEQVAEKIFSR
jgi:ATP-dependent Lon protease